jgi:hypothetical protein
MPFGMNVRFANSGHSITAHYANLRLCLFQSSLNVFFKPGNQRFQRKSKTKTSPTGWVYKRIFDCGSTFEFKILKLDFKRIKLIKAAFEPDLRKQRTPGLLIRFLDDAFTDTASHHGSTFFFKHDAAGPVDENH